MKSNSAPRPAEASAVRERRVVLMYSTGPSMSQFTPRPTYTLYSDGELVASDASLDDPGWSVLRLSADVVTRIIELVDEIPPRDAEVERRQDAKTICYAAWHTSGEQVVLKLDEWTHPQGEEALSILHACVVLAGGR